MSAHASPEGGNPEAQAYDGVLPLADVSRLAHRYEGFILDQWGVLHDGARPYAGALDCLRQLRASGKRIVVLSNSGKREDDNVELMRAMGFERALYDRFVSAGEDARQAVVARRHAFHRALGRRCYAFTRDGDLSVFAGIGLEFTDRVESADFLAVLGIDSPRRQLRDYEAELEAAAARRLPMICANPDLWRFAGDGMIEAAGVLARRYEALGGQVFYHGKPHAPIYATCIEILGCAPERMIAIGDSVEHDILGAVRAGIPCALLAGGVHAADLDVTWGKLPEASAWRRFASGAAATPDYLLPAFVW